MASARYSRLSTGDGEETKEDVTFDFSSHFTFEKRDPHLENFKSVFTYGKHDDKKVHSAKVSKRGVEKGTSDRFAWMIVYFGYLVVYLMIFPVLAWFSFKRVKEGERMVIFRLGHLQKAKGPGIAFVFPFLDKCQKKDVSLRAFSVPPKQVITFDKAIIEVGAEIYFQIVEVEKSVTNVQDLDRSTRVLVQTCLCNLLAQKDLADIETERRAIADTLLEKSNVTCSGWGVQITRAELSQVKVLSQPLPKQTPSVMMPPGMFGSNSSPGLPSIFAQLAASVGGNNGQQGKTEAITQALQVMVTSNFSSSTSSHESGAAASPDSQASTAETYSSTSETASSTVTSKPVQAVMEPHHIVSLIRHALCSEVVNKVQETFQIEISGPGAGTYFLDLCNGEGSLNEGPDPTGVPSATLSMTFDDLQAMLQGKLKPYQAYMSGRLHVAGDTAAALKLDELGSRIQAQISSFI